MSKSEVKITFRRCVEKKSGSVILASNIRGVDPDRGSMQSSRKYDILVEDSCLTIPDEFTAIEAFAFEACDSIPDLEIVLPENITSIGWGAFQGLENLKSVTLPKKLKAIPNYAFNNCTGIVQIEIPDKVEKIEQEAFAGCSNLKSITLPAKLKKIGPYAFSGCCFERISLPESNGIFTVANGLLMSKSCEKVFAAENRPEGIVIPPEVTSISKGVFALHQNAVLIIPGAWPKALTKEIKASQIREIRINDTASLPKTLVKLAVPLAANAAKEENPFDNWILPTEDRDNEIITIPDGVTELRKGMFKHAKSMKELNVPDSVQRICTGAFNGAENLKTIRIGKGLQEIEADAFPSECRVQDIHFACSSEQIRISPIASVHKLEWKALLHFENVEPRTLGGFPMPKNISIEEAKILFVVKKSNKSGAYSIEVPNGGGYFGNKIYANYSPAVGKCIGEFCYGVTDKHISVPETIMGAPIEKISTGMFPADAIIYCTPEIFVKTAKSIRTETSVAWLEGDPLFTDAQAECIRDFIQRNSIDVCECLLRSNSIDAHAKFAQMAKIKLAMLDKLIEAEYSDAMIRAFWLNQKNNSKSFMGVEDTLSLDAPRKWPK